MTEQRGGGTPRTWELKEVSSAAEVDTLRESGWKHAGVIHQEPGGNIFLMKRKMDRQTASQTAAARPPFCPMLITTLGTNTTADGTWRIGVSETALDLTRLTVGHGAEDGFPISGWSSTTSPEGWKAQPGWFVYIESESRVWAYDGSRKLLLNTETRNGNSQRGSLYESGYPCAVPDEVLSRLSEPARKDIHKHE